MSEYVSADKPNLYELPQVRDRYSFLYLERCVINRKDSSITVTDKRGAVHVPAASLGVLMLGPGSDISHRAVELLADCGASIIWVGERGVRYYAHGRPLTHSSRLLQIQAELVSNRNSRLKVARMMYQMRFPNEDVSGLTMQQLRGREGARIRSVYKQASKDSGVEWNGRAYNPDDFESSDTVNMALSAAHACLYGISHAVIVALGCSPGLGFIHSGHEKSFVYDIADLYKAEITIPIAFKIAASASSESVGSETRHAVRDYIADGKILERASKDIKKLLSIDSEIEPDMGLINDSVYLWDENSGYVKNATLYGKDDESDSDAYELIEMDDLLIGSGHIFEDEI
ncbi:MAG: type I-E CRISPR-associated endonuclease Cas1e [Eubacteriaceae bacterium]|nr:type I-E CRISPR-associated endonuclease Cas1e [Eubacteriaceae bacterium]